MDTTLENLGQSIRTALPGVVTGHEVVPQVLPGDHFYFQQDLAAFFARLNPVLDTLRDSATASA